MAEKEKWNHIKKTLKDKSVKELEDMLKEFETEKLKLEIELRKVAPGGRGSYPAGGEWKNRGNLGFTRKKIACVLTFLNQRKKNGTKI